MRRNELISYAMDFAGYLIKKVDGIEKIILHGSVSRGDFDEDSDIDLFVEVLDKNKEKEIRSAEEEYYKTESFKRWKLKGFDNDFSILVGKLDSDEWKDLKRAIVNTGILLFGKFKSNIEKINQYTLFVLENIKPDKKRIAVFRKLFGFKIKNKVYPGDLDKINGIKLGKGMLLVSAEHSKKIKDYLKSKKVTPKIYDFWSDVEIVK
ncbi:MAG: nucleotidyltransferase domain-containing protein [archaeon]